MSDRIQEALDGELAPNRLQPAERDEFEAYEEATDRALARLRSEAAPDLTPAVMERIAALPRHGGSARPTPFRTALEWLWLPRQVSLRPAWGLAAAALAALLIAVPWGPAGQAGPGGAPLTDAGAAGAASSERIFVHFRLDAAQARSVHLAGDFTGWRPAYTLNETAPGVWTVVVPVAPGVHEYGFVVDGERWVADPLAPRVEDGFGGVNSRLDVVRPDAGRSL